MKIFADTTGDERQFPLTSNIHIEKFFQKININLPQTKKINHPFKKTTTKKNYISSDNSDNSSDSDHESDEEKNINNENHINITEDNGDSDVNNILEINNCVRKKRKMGKDDTKCQLINNGRKKRKNRDSYNN